MVEVIDQAAIDRANRQELEERGGEELVREVAIRECGPCGEREARSPEEIVIDREEGRV